jgi:hypothetical protein
MRPLDIQQIGEEPAIKWGVRLPEKSGGAGGLKAGCGNKKVPPGKKAALFKEKLNL